MLYSVTRVDGNSLDRHCKSKGLGSFCWSSQHLSPRLGLHTTTTEAHVQENLYSYSFIP